MRSTARAQKPTNSVTATSAAINRPAWASKNFATGARGSLKIIATIARMVKMKIDAENSTIAKNGFLDEEPSAGWASWGETVSIGPYWWGTRKKRFEGIIKLAKQESEW